MEKESLLLNTEVYCILGRRWTSSLVPALCKEIQLRLSQHDVSSFSSDKGCKHSSVTFVHTLSCRAKCISVPPAVRKNNIL